MASSQKTPSASTNHDAESPRTESLRQQQKQYTRARLIDSATEVFARTGYAAATIEEIASAAGASRATFYLHFKSKAEVVTEMVAVSLGPEADKGTRSLWRLEDPTIEELRQWIEGATDYYKRHDVQLAILEQAAAADPAVVGKEWSQRLLDRVDDLARYLSERKGLEPDTARLRAILLLAQLDRFCFFWLRLGVDIDIATAIDALAELWWQAFQPPKSER